MENKFIQAQRAKLRFTASVGGGLTVEDLWDLPLTSDKKSSLNSVAKYIAKQIRDEDTEDFVGTTTSSQKENALRLEIVKYIIAVKQEENLAAQKLISDKTRRDRILNLIEKKQEEELGSKSIEELTALL